MPSPAEEETPFPTLPSSTTLHRSHLSPHDANLSPPRRFDSVDGAADRGLRMSRINGSSRSGSRRRKRTWKKLMWVKQSCMFPDKPLAVQHSLYQRRYRSQIWNGFKLTSQTPIIIQIKRRFSKTYNETPDLNLTTSGHSLLTPPSSSNMSVVLSFSSSALSPSFKSAYLPFPSSAGAALARF